MSDTEDHDFDLSKLARKLSISSEDWQSDSSSQSGQRHSGPASNDAPGESYASDNAPPDKPRYDISASIPPRSSSKPHGVPSSTEAALTTPALSRESSPRSPFDLSSVSETPKAIKVNTSLTGLGLSSANDPLWPQTFDKSPGSLSALHPPYATTGLLPLLTVFTI